MGIHPLRRRQSGRLATSLRRLAIFYRFKLMLRSQPKRLFTPSRKR
jgi:hypothetical protein